MQPEVILSIIGTFLVLGLGINGYFLRGIFQDLNDVKVQLAVNIANSLHNDSRMQSLEDQLKDIRLTYLNHS